MRRHLHILLLSILIVPLSAQSQRWLEHSEIGCSIGGMNYIGDLNNQTVFGKVHLGYGGFVRYKIDPRWAIAVGGSYGMVSGGNPDWIQRRNLSFRSPIWEGYARAEFNYQPFGLKGKSFPWSTFLFAGIGVFGFNPSATYIDNTGESHSCELRPLGTEGQGSTMYPDRKMYRLTQLMMPFGIGIRYRPSKSLYLTMEYGFRKTWTDYIDDVSTTYVDPACLSGEGLLLYDRTYELEEGYHNPIGSRRGDDSLKDWYAYFNISISISTEFLFGWMRKKRC